MANEYYMDYCLNYEKYMDYQDYYQETEQERMIWEALTSLQEVSKNIPIDYFIQQLPEEVRLYLYNHITPKKETEQQLYISKISNNILQQAFCNVYE